MEGNLEDLLATLNISGEDSRSSAKKKKVSSKKICAVCHKAFRSKGKLKKHVKREHYADKDVIKKEFFEAREAHEKPDADEVDEHNYTLALMKVTALEKFWP